MTKHLYFSLGSVAIIALSFFSIKQVSTISKKNQLLVKQDHYISELKLISAEDEATIVDLQSENELLKEQIIVLTDSIETLNKRIALLQKKTTRQQRAIKDLNAQLALYQNRYDELESEIAQHRNTTYQDQTKLRQLKSERQQLMMQVSDLQDQKTIFEVAQAENALRLEAEAAEEARLHRLTNIINNTQVKFNVISPRKKRYGKTIKKIKKNWNYTIVDFDFIHDDLQYLLDGTFLVKIVNTNTQEVIAASDKDSDSETGIRLQYTGNNVELAFYNHQPRAGKNYEIQVYYLDQKGKEYLLRHGTRQFVLNGKTVR